MLPSKLVLRGPAYPGCSVDSQFILKYSRFAPTQEHFNLYTQSDEICKPVKKTKVSVFIAVYRRIPVDILER